jgi:MFS family permease
MSSTGAAGVMSLACSMSETIYFFVAARILLGLAGGAIIPVGQSVLLNEYPENLRTFGIGLWGVLSMLPFMAGIYIGGWYSEHLGWRYLFYLNILVALLAAGVVGSLLYGRGYRRRFPRFDFVGFFLLSAILLGMQTIFNQGNDFDWFHSHILVGALVVVVLALPCFVIWELGERHPALDMRLFAQRNYTVATVCSVVGFFVIQGLLSLFIVQLQLLLGYSSSLAGGVFLSMLLLSIPSAAIVHELFKGFDVRLICCLNFLGFAVTLTWLGLFDKTASFDQIAWPMTFFGFSLAMFFAPLASLAMYGLQGAQLLRAAEGVRAAAHRRRRLRHRAARGGYVSAHALSRARSFRPVQRETLRRAGPDDAAHRQASGVRLHAGDGKQSGRALSAARSGAAGLERRLSARRRHVCRSRRLRLARPRHPPPASDHRARVEATRSRRADGTDMTRRRLFIAPAAGLATLQSQPAHFGVDGLLRRLGDPKALFTFKNERHVRH